MSHPTWKNSTGFLVTSARRLCFRLGLFVGLFVRLFVNKITEKVMDGF